MTIIGRAQPPLYITTRPDNCTCTWVVDDAGNDWQFGRFVMASFMCPAQPHPSFFLTPPPQPDKVEPMTTKTVYIDTPDIYEDDLRNIVKMMDALDTINEGNDLYVEEVKVHNKNDYFVGTLTLIDGEYWKLTLNNESDVVAHVELVTDDGFSS